MDFVRSVRERVAGRRQAEAGRPPSGSRRGGRRPAARRRPATIVPWYLIVLGIAVAASTNAAQKRAVDLLTAEDDATDPLPGMAPDWMKQSRGARSLWTVLNRVSTRIGQDNLTLAAAGVAFYTMFALFPAMGALVSIYGLFGDAHVVQNEVQQLTSLLPAQPAKLINDALNALTAKPKASLNWGLVVSLCLAIWGARAGTSSLMSGLNVALERRENRGILEQNAVAIGLTFGAIVFSIVVLASVAVLPIVINVLPIDEDLKYWLAYLRWPLLGAFILMALDVIYRFAPSATRPRWQFLSAGTVFATALWMVGSWAFSFYVTRFGSYDSTYGSLGAVIVLLLWFWMSAFIVLVGATIDAVRAEMRR